MTRRRTRGFTLVELLAALAVLGVGLAVASLALIALRPAPGSEGMRTLAAAREAAVRTGQPVLWRGDSAAVRFLPDGSSNGGTIVVDNVRLVVDPLTGMARAVR